MKPTYKPTMETHGHLSKRPIGVVHMPRERFVRLIDEHIENGNYDRKDAIRREVMPTAETMPRFPFSTWLSSSRGCGCLIGEYLVAKHVIDKLAREAVLDQASADLEVRRELAPIMDRMDIAGALGEHVGAGLAGELQTLGNNIDGVLRRHVNEHTSMEDRLSFGALSAIVIDD